MDDVTHENIDVVEAARDHLENDRNRLALVNRLVEALFATSRDLELDSDDGSRERQQSQQ